MKDQNKKNNATLSNPTNAKIADDLITAANVQTIGERIAIRALKTCEAKSGMPFMHKLYADLIGDIAERKNDSDPLSDVYNGDPLSDGYDVADEAIVFLVPYIGKRLSDPTADGQTDKNGDPVSIKRACFRAVNRYIMGERQREYKRAYVDDTDENGKTLYYEIPAFWDLPTFEDFRKVNEMIASLDLPVRQSQVLRYRLRGDSIDKTAQKMGVTRQAVQNLLRKIREKATAIGLCPNA